jgi:hypothetical protein
MVIAYWSINPSYIKYMICTSTLCRKTNCGKFIIVYQHYRVVICITTHPFLTMIFPLLRLHAALERSFLGFLFRYWTHLLCHCYFYFVSDTLCCIRFDWLRASHSSQCRAKPFVASESEAIRRICRAKPFVASDL